MYIQAIDLENFRGFKEAQVAFNKDLNIFIGENASGKTSLLRSISQTIINLISVNSKFEIPNSLRLSESDINREGKNLKIEIGIEVPDGNINELKNYHLIFKKGKFPYDVETYVQYEISKSKKVLLNIYEQYFLETTFNKGRYLFPMFKIYNSNRSFSYKSTQETNVIFSNSKLEAWYNFLNNNLSFSKLLEWFFENETKELRLQRDNNDFSIESPVLKPIRIALNEAFKILQNKDYLVKSDQITREGSNKLIPTLVIENKNDKNDREILDNKSDGEKAIITLIADIAYNLAIANSNNENFMQGTGVVMIDEIEAHLHPAWQRKVVGLLHDLFPNIQFFITTHSPQVIASVNSDKVFLCDNFNINKINLSTKGADTNSLLKYVFNATDRPLEFVKLIEAFDKAMEENQDEEILQKIIDQIKEKKEEDEGQDIDLLVDELGTQLEAYKFDREHEMDK